ncbi:MAG TPA: A/G-specific adenine glycosylase [Acidimicrobiales bacterium]|nr:A/G-specific adenine glycosylase [Acidimicrobiales bacterium]
MEEVAVAAAVGAWGAAARRDLPWRHTRDPWAVLVSEVMLQQTQVARVAPRWAAWLERWPTPSALAAAAPGEVIGAWHGLGYNRRALALRAAAVALVDRHGGALPDDLAALRALPGIGPYTARAVLAFAFERDVAVVDVNVARVVARVAGRRLGPAQAQALADRLVPPGQAWAHNSAMLDLGATTCTARAPRCGACPLAGTCAWRGDGPDPAAPLARQGRFEGSDRQGRGRLVAALRDGPVPAGGLAAAAGWPDDPARARRAAAGLVADGLAAHAPDGGLTWPAVPVERPAATPAGPLRSRPRQAAHPPRS